MVFGAISLPLFLLIVGSGSEAGRAYLFVPGPACAPPLARRRLAVDPLAILDLLHEVYANAPGYSTRILTRSDLTRRWKGVNFAFATKDPLLPLRSLPPQTAVDWVRASAFRLMTAREWRERR